MASLVDRTHTGDMSVPVPPPSTPAPPPPPPLRRERLAHPAALFAAAAGLGVLAATVVGGGIGLLVAAGASADCSTNDGWCELGAALFGLLAAVLAGAIAYIVAGVALVVRCRPTGRRAFHILAHLAAPFALVLLGALLGTITG